MRFKIDSELSEDQIVTDVSSYLGFITPIFSKRYRLICVDEQLTGADQLFDRFVPIYLQFKVSQGLNPNSSLIQQYFSKPLTNIITYRTQNRLGRNPILYFQLRRKAKTASDFQHNILHSLNSQPHQHGLYVAPLTLDLSEYESQLNSDWLMKLYPFDPFVRREVEVIDAATQRNFRLGLNPFLRHHISIPPHTRVSTHDHHYSFSKSGDVAWHGGEVLTGDFRLSSQLLKILNSFYSSDKQLGFTAEQFIVFINDFNREFEISRYIPLNDEIFPTEIILEFARELRRKFQIVLMLLVESKV